MYVQYNAATTQAKEMADTKQVLLLVARCALSPGMISRVFVALAHIVPKGGFCYRHQRPVPTPLDLNDYANLVQPLLVWRTFAEYEPSMRFDTVQIVSFKPLVKILDLETPASRF